MIEIESAILKIIDGLVDNNGHWNNAVETELEPITIIERFPKLFSPRDQDIESRKSTERAFKLALKLRLFKDY